MRQKVAFRFISELLGDITYIAELSKDPARIHVEAALSALHMASEVFTTFLEYFNTKKLRKAEQVIREEHSEIEKKQMENYELEAIRLLEVKYETLKSKITEERFQAKEVREFIGCLQKELLRTIDCLKTIQMDPNFVGKDRAEEAMRRSLSAYNKLVILFIEEEKDDDESKQKQPD